MGRIRDGHIGTKETIAMLILLTGAEVFRAHPTLLIRMGQSAAWIIQVTSTFLAIVPFLFLASLMKKFPEKSIIQVSKEVLGSFLGSFFSLLIFILFMLNTFSILRVVIEIFKITVLPLTPISVLAAFYLLACLYVSYQGIESISRGVWLFAPFLLLAVYLVIFGSFSFFNVCNIYPILGPGIPKLATSSILTVSMFSSTIIFSGIIYPYLRNSQKFRKVGLISILFSGFTITIMVLSYLLIYDVQPASEVIIPLYEMAKLIFLGRFVQRLESIFIVVWVFSGLFRVSIYLYGSAQTLAEIMKLPTYKPLLFPLALLIFTFSLTPESVPASFKFNAILLQNYNLISALFPIILFAVYWVKKKLKGT